MAIATARPGLFADPNCARKGASRLWHADVNSRYKDDISDMYIARKWESEEKQEL